jgi:hypothetical protein
MSIMYVIKTNGEGWNYKFKQSHICWCEKD